MVNKVLLHACCATCAGYPLEKLAQLDYEVTVYYSNSNIYPESEYKKRLDELLRYTKKKNIELIIDEYNPVEWLEYIKGYENEPEKGKRCPLCFEFRLKKTADKAKELGIEIFTTTLTVSPHKNSKVIFEVAQNIEINSSIEFLAIDFKKQNGFLKGMQIAKEEKFYRQNYCGCKFSVRQ